MKKLFYLEIVVAGYTYWVISETEEGCHKAMKPKYYRLKNYLQPDRTYEEWLDYTGAIVRKAELNKVFE